MFQKKGDGCSELEALMKARLSVLHFICSFALTLHRLLSEQIWAIFKKPLIYMKHAYTE